MAGYSIQIDPMLIEAPAAVAWDVLTDFSSYPEWNKFTVKVTTDLKVGEPMHVYVARDGKVARQNFRLDAYEPPRLIAWSLPKIIHPWLFRAYREQEIKPVSETSCEYSTCDTFYGLIAGLIYKSQKDWVVESFTKMAADLKMRVESFTKNN